MASLFQRFVKLSFKVANEYDEKWEYTEEPHTSRRQEILKKHPEIKQLMGYDPFITLIVTFEVLAQVLMCYLIQDASWFTIILTSYVISGSFNHSLGSAIHEIGHNLAFGHKRPWANRLLGIWANMPLAVPFSVTYKKYHSDHHRYMGHQMMDVDIPATVESWFFRHPITKLVWLIFHPFIHAIRPFLKSPKPVVVWEVANFFGQLAFDVLIYNLFGIYAIAYLVLGTFFSMGFHPLAGHFFSEHYLYNKGQATHSYYGSGNILLFNVGYHVEHHDFPYIPYRKLPLVRKLAPEFYEHLPYHTSWFKVLWDFIMDPTMGPHAHGVGYLPENPKTNPYTDKTVNGLANGIHKPLANGNLANGKVANGKINNGISNNNSYHGKHD